MNQSVSIKPKILIKALHLLTILDTNPQIISKKLKVSPATWFRIRNTLKLYGIKIKLIKKVYKITDYGFFNKNRIRKLK